MIKDTKIAKKHENLPFGVLVEVEGVTCEGKFVASEIEGKKKK